MRRLVQGVTLALLCTGLSVTPGMLGSAQGAAPSKPDLTHQLREQARGQVQVSKNKATGKTSFVRVGRSGDLMPSARNDKVGAFVRTYARAFGAPAAQLVRTGTTRDRLGTTVSYTQRYHGIPVFGTKLLAHLDKGGRLTAVNGQLVPVGSLSMTRTLSAGQAARDAVRLVRAEPPGRRAQDRPARTTGLRAASSKLVVYRHGLVQGVKGGKTELVYQVEVTNGKNIRDMVFVSANGGKVVNRYSMVDNALHRILYEASLKPNGTIHFKQVWEEGDRYPGKLNPDEKNMVDSTGEAYWFFHNVFGRDSYDGAGHTMTTVNNDPRIACPNANWNGTTTNYCDGVSSDDVVAHEWGHAYTEYTSGLIYQWQSGAMNEGYSDIWGETIDLVNHRQDEGEGDINAKRPVGLCSSHSPALPLLTVNSPFQRDCLTGGASFGAQPTATGITEDVVTPTTNDPAQGLPTEGCSAYDQDVTGKIVLVDRGTCSFVQKAQVATAEGAAALIIGNRDDAPIGMSGDDSTLVTTVSIGLTDREDIRAAIAGGQTVNVTIKDAGGERFDSYRWLIGEKSPAFGGAIRDMWVPTCYGDPGKVSDAEYKCSADDNGGVHGNSGVVNHSYSLLVDGGTYNGQTVTGIGLDKAANIYWRNQTTYLTPASNFADLADGLQASCADLTGHALNKLSVVPDDSQRSNNKITANDCAQVAKVADAVELRRDPTEQCGWQPILDPNAPALCDGTATDVYAEDFEDGLDGWTLSGANAFGGPTRDWEATTDAPGDHAGGVAYGPAPDFGQCDGSTNDFSSVNYLTSGAIQVPTGGTAKLSFDHYIATENGFDGGNLQVSVDGGEFAPVPAAAYTFNAPGNLSTAAEGSTDPLAGQPGFTGTNPGSPFGSWGQSQIDLSQLDVAGKTITLRFAIGRDGCGGVDGWYVDNVRVITCSTPSAAPRAGTTPARRTAAG